MVKSDLTQLIILILCRFKWFKLTLQQRFWNNANVLTSFKGFLGEDFEVRVFEYMSRGLIKVFLEIDIVGSLLWQRWIFGNAIRKPLLRCSVCKILLFRFRPPGIVYIKTVWKGARERLTRIFCFTLYFAIDLSIIGRDLFCICGHLRSAIIYFIK